MCFQEFDCATVELLKNYHGRMWILVSVRLARFWTFPQEFGVCFLQRTHDWCEAKARKPSEV